MPVPPHSWADNQDYLTAKLLNGDLACYSGKEFTPTGVNFHARRPIYKSFDNSSPGSVAAGNWALAYEAGVGNQKSAIIADTAGHVGWFMDPFQSGNFNLRIPGGGGTSGSQGGLLLASGYALWPQTTNNGIVAAGLGNANGTQSSNDGTFQGLNQGTNICPFVLDIIDGNNSNRWALWAYNNSGGALTPVGTANADGSGQATRIQAHWVSAYPGNGTKLSSLPVPVSNYTSSTQLTATMLNSQLGNVLAYLNMPPLLRAQGVSGNQSLTASTTNYLNLGAATYDTYSGWDASSNIYTVPMTGLYLVHGIVTCQNFSGELRAGVQVNGTNYWGPRALGPGSGEFSAAKTQIFSLQAGDKIELIAWPSVAATTSSLHLPRLIVLQVANRGAPPISVSLPDTTYRWTAGTPGPLATLFNQHIANDLNFLTYRPYLMAYQQTVQSGIAMNAGTGVTMDTVGGIVWGDNGDNYSKWSSVNNNYVAPVSGWYMAVWEIFLASPSLTTNPWVAAAITVTPAGTTQWDTYQRQNMTISGQNPGAAGIAYYYLRAGDTIQPGVVTGASSSTTIATAVNPGINSHFELVWLGE
jgi:hypothetical protein